MKSEGQKASQHHEKRLAKVLGGTQNAGSGSFWLRKGDVRTWDLTVEHKWTGKTQFTLKADVLEGTMDEALMSGRTGVIGFHLMDRDYVVMAEEDFLALRRAAQETDGTLPGLDIPLSGEVPSER